MNLFNALSQITKYGAQKGDNAVARMKQLNDIINNLAPSYAVTPASGDISMSSKNSRQVLNSPTISTAYNIALQNDVLSLLEGPGEGNTKINIAQVPTNDFGFRIDTIRLTVGAGLASYDGGDLELYLGDTLIGKAAAALLTVVNPGEAIEYAIIPDKLFAIGVGTFSSLTGTDITYDNTLNVRLTSPTILFDGIIGINIFTNSRTTGCGTYCDTCTGGTKGSAGLKCNSSKCAICKTSAFDASDVISA
jgi:hypothetical protein